MIAIVHSIYSQSVHALALNAGSMDNDAERYCTCKPQYTCVKDVFIRNHGVHRLKLTKLIII